MWFIQKDKDGIYFESETNIESGLTYPDYLNGATIKITDYQYRYHLDFQDRSVEEVLNICSYDGQNIEYYISEAAPTLEAAKEMKLQQIGAYDDSEAVNDVIINNTIHGWVDAEQRANYRSSLDSAKRMGLTQVSFFVDNNLFTISVEQAEDMLAAIQIYADQCFIVTKQHEINVQSLSTIEEVEAYDYTAGYPAKLNFTI